MSKMYKAAVLILGVLLPTACFPEWMDEEVVQGDPAGGGEVECNVDSGLAGATDRECRILELVNEVRAEGADCREAGRFGPASPLKMNRHLLEAARLHSQDMAERNYFDHESPGGPNGDDMQERVESAGYVGWKALGENIAAGQLLPEDTMQGWMLSDNHCANIMNPEFTELGVGYAVSPTSEWVHYWTQNFGTRR